MKFAISAAALLGLVSTVSAAPTTKRETRTIYPTTLSQYNVWTGAVTYNTGKGKIFKDGHSPDTTTLITFDIPSDLAGATCEAIFQLDDGSLGGVALGTKRFQVFTSQAPATTDTTTWPSGNLRDHYGGTFEVNLGGEATLVDGVNRFPAPAGYIVGGEMVGQGDYVDIEWTQGDGVGAILVCGWNF